MIDLTTIAESPEQLTNGNHPEGTQGEEQNGGMSHHYGIFLMIASGLTLAVRIERPFPDLR
jgi:hypothetical protein